MTTRSSKQERTVGFTLVLSGGGLKGLAHVGVLRALAERGLQPSLVVGSSIGSLVGAAWAAGIPLEVLTRRALDVRRRDIFQVAHYDMAFRRLLSPAIYRREPLDRLLAAVLGDRTFHDLLHPLLVSTVDLNSGAQVVWGTKDRRDARLADTVFASCALPGIFPPREIAGRYYVDGAVVENLPVRLAAHAAPDQPLLAVNVAAATGVVRERVEEKGFAATYIRGLEIVMQSQISNHLRTWEGPPLLLVEPRVEHVSMFSFRHNAELLGEGYRATAAALETVGSLDRLPSGFTYLAPAMPEEGETEAA
jgi:NTE family protein